MLNKVRYKLMAKGGVGTVEIILILVVLIALVLIFKDEIIALVESIFTQINNSTKEVY